MHLHVPYKHIHVVHVMYLYKCKSTVYNQHFVIFFIWYLTLYTLCV